MQTALTCEQQQLAVLLVSLPAVVAQQQVNNETHTNGVLHRHSFS